MRDEFRQAMAQVLGCDSSRLSEAGVTVAADPERSASGVTAGYQLGSQLVVSCPPDVEAMLTAATREIEPTLAGWESLAAELSGELLGRVRMQLHGGADPSVPVLPAGYSYRSLDRTSEADLALIARLIEISSEDDLDEAEVEIDDLDPTIEVIVDATGDIASYAAGRAFDMAEAFGDIGILTRTDCRGLGLGSAAVITVMPRLRAVGLEPLYRCDEENTGSVRLSAAIGFTPATRLTAYRFPAT